MVNIQALKLVTIITSWNVQPLRRTEEKLKYKSIFIHKTKETRTTVIQNIKKKNKTKIIQFLHNTQQLDFKEAAKTTTLSRIKTALNQYKKYLYIFFKFNI